MEIEAERISTTSGSLRSEGGGILSRGDGPAQAVLHANAQAMALRKAAETQEQLGEINDRVEKTLDSYILADATEQPITGSEIVKIKDKYVKDKEATLELVDDLTQLIIILSDPIAKKKYQQQVTIFIVGYENLCGNRVKLLQQLNDFFTQNSKDDDAYEIEHPDFDIEEVGRTVRNALDRAEKAQERLNTVSQEVVKVLETVNPKEAKSRKKKLEKAITQSRDDIIQLTEKLANVQKELGTSEDKLSKLYKTLEGKQLEIEKLKGHVEMGKRKAQELDELRTEMEQKSAILVKTRQEMDKLKLQLARAEDKHENVSNKQKESREKQQRMQSDLEEKLREQKDKIVEIRQAMEKQHDQELRDLRNTYQKELDDTRSKYQDQIDNLTAQLTLSEKQRDDAEKERAELQRFTTSFFNDEGEQSHSATKMSWKASANAMRLTSTKKSQRSLGTDSIPATPKGILKNDGSVASLKSSKSFDNVKSSSVNQPDRSNTDTVPFPGYTMTPTSKIPEDAVLQQGRSFVNSTVDGGPGTPGLLSSPEKSIASRGKRRTGKMVKSRTSLSRKSTKQALSTQEESNPNEVEMVDEAVQTEVLIPENKNEESEAEAVLRRMSVIPLAESLVKELSDMDENTNWDEFPIQEIPARFAQYRNLAKKKEEEMMEEVNELKLKYNNKVQALKGMMDLRNNWTTEREELIRQLTTLQALKEEAENEAEMAVLQVEELMAEQEELRMEIEMKTKALSEIQTMPSPLPTAASLHEIRAETENRESDSEDDAKSVTTNTVSRPTTIPTIVQTDDSRRSEVILSSEPNMLTLEDDIPERIMSAKARTRLVNSALSRHPVADETLNTYKNIIEFKNSIENVLSREELDYEANLLQECEVVLIDEENKLSVLERVSDIRRSTSQILECISDILPGLISTEDILFSNFDEPPSNATEERSRPRLPSIEELQEPIQQTHKDSSLFKVLPKNSDTLTVIEKSDRRDSVTSAVSQESEMESKISSDLMSKVSSDHISKAGSDDVGQEIEQKQQQQRGKAPSQQLTEPKKPVTLLSPDDRFQSKKQRKLTPKEGRKKLVADYKELIDKHQQLKEEFENLTRNTRQISESYEQQLGQNASIMQEMQDRIDKLTEQIQSFDITHPLTVKASQIASPDFMFTRLDMEHNAKALKRGLQNGRISYEGYKSMCSKMDEYLSIPVKRLARMARKYLHHTRMKEVENAIRSSRSLDDKVYDLLDKMEGLQQTRTTRWEQRMQNLAGEREEIARLLVKTLEMIEHETGIFLIKPIMSVPSRKRIGSGYLVSRRVKSAKDDITRQQSSRLLGPCASPSQPDKTRPSNKSSASILSFRKLDDDALVMDVKPVRNERGASGGVWKVQSSVSTPSLVTKSLPEVPKILELDVNRSMFTNNNISAKVSSSGEQYGGPLHSNMLSYVTVARPVGEISKGASTHYNQSSATENSPPPPSPLEEQFSVYQLHMPQTPLPPINASQFEYEDRRSVSTYLSDADRHWSPVFLRKQVNEGEAKN